ncbi:uncharacterized protein ASCRUDRAFT_76751 [Ascoidea rubescens DSM 1968]|uniref:Uncharacterized protein n=1 Tax=Ascoidea rubescens DSM 1968 TaxID=1344418 RepID=A0A1D2VE62_9ASCO|nr:hypothetical protein ASCRUDRAFT_76751 [Ascoidea rubescens DSM 1968]ODV59783.1 hypothetical protein ASCRUDRAFT_76751 [Ascoidea rubescens DSM 1968]
MSQILHQPNNAHITSTNILAPKNADSVPNHLSQRNNINDNADGNNTHFNTTTNNINTNINNYNTNINSYNNNINHMQGPLPFNSSNTTKSIPEIYPDPTPSILNTLNITPTELNHKFSKESKLYEENEDTISHKSKDIKTPKSNLNGSNDSHILAPIDNNKKVQKSIKSLHSTQHQSKSKRNTPDTITNSSFSASVRPKISNDIIRNYNIPTKPDTDSKKVNKSDNKDQNVLFVTNSPLQNKNEPKKSYRKSLTRRFKFHKKLNHDSFNSKNKVKTKKNKPSKNKSDKYSTNLSRKSSVYSQDSRLNRVNSAYRRASGNYLDINLKRENQNSEISNTAVYSRNLSFENGNNDDNSKDISNNNINNNKNKNTESKDSDSSMINQQKSKKWFFFPVKRKSSLSRTTKNPSKKQHFHQNYVNLYLRNTPAESVLYRKKSVLLKTDGNKFVIFKKTNNIDPLIKPNFESKEALYHKINEIFGDDDDKNSLKTTNSIVMNNALPKYLLKFGYDLNQDDLTYYYGLDRKSRRKYYNLNAKDNSNSNISISENEKPSKKNIYLQLFKVSPKLKSQIKYTDFDENKNILLITPDMSRKNSIKASSWYNTSYQDDQKIEGIDRKLRKVQKQESQIETDDLLSDGNLKDTEKSKKRSTNIEGGDDEDISDNNSQDRTSNLENLRIIEKNSQQTLKKNKSNEVGDKSMDKSFETSFDKSIKRSFDQSLDKAFITPVQNAATSYTNEKVHRKVDSFNTTKDTNNDRSVNDNKNGNENENKNVDGGNNENNENKYKKPKAILNNDNIEDSNLTIKGPISPIALINPNLTPTNNMLLDTMNTDSTNSSLISAPGFISVSHVTGKNSRLLSPITLSHQKLLEDTKGVSAVKTSQELGDKDKKKSVDSDINSKNKDKDKEIDKNSDRNSDKYNTRNRELTDEILSELNKKDELKADDLSKATKSENIIIVNKEDDKNKENKKAEQVGREKSIQGYIPREAVDGKSKLARVTDQLGLIIGRDKKEKNEDIKRGSSESELSEKDYEMWNEYLRKVINERIKWRLNNSLKLDNNLANEGRDKKGDEEISRDGLVEKKHQRKKLRSHMSKEKLELINEMSRNRNRNRNRDGDDVSVKKEKASEIDNNDNNDNGNGNGNEEFLGVEEINYHNFNKKPIKTQSLFNFDVKDNYLKVLNLERKKESEDAEQEKVREYRDRQLIKEINKQNKSLTQMLVATRKNREVVRTNESLNTSRNSSSSSFKIKTRSKISLLTNLDKIENDSSFEKYLKGGESFESEIEIKSISTTDLIHGIFISDEELSITSYHSSSGNGSRNNSSNSGKNMKKGKDREIKTIIREPIQIQPLSPLRIYQNKLAQSQNAFETISSHSQSNSNSIVSSAANSIADEEEQHLRFKRYPASLISVSSSTPSLPHQARRDLIPGILRRRTTPAPSGELSVLRSLSRTSLPAGARSSSSRNSSLRVAV